MATGFVASGRGDLDLLFAARVSAAVANTGFKNSVGTDLAQLFEPRGATTPILDTGFVAGVNDLAQVFKGISAESIGISSVVWQSISVPNPISSYILTSGGDIQRVNSGPATDQGDWIAPKASAPGAYEARATLVSGTVTGGTMGTWLPLTSNRTWTVSRSSGAPSGSDSGTFTLEIRDGGGVVKATATIQLIATKP